GLGANGKDSIREVVSLIYGSSHVSNFALNDFIDYDNGNKNSLAGLSKSKVNWASENGRTTRIDNSLSLKKFATGDSLTERYLFKDGVEYTPNAIALFNLNELPNLFASGQAAVDRFVPLTFNKTFVKLEDYDPSNPNQQLADPRFKYDREFLINEVCPAFLNYMIKGLEDL
ncbi:MAG: heavy metal transporter, partial [Sphaerospermopsis kisseleviana]